MVTSGICSHHGINSAYVLGYSGAVMVLLRWVGGVIALTVATAASLYENILIARIHEVGGKGHIRYRDLAGFVYSMLSYLSRSVARNHIIC